MLFASCDAACPSCSVGQYAHEAFRWQELGPCKSCQHFECSNAQWRPDRKQQVIAAEAFF